jgi:hypothetical protein
MEHPLNGNIPVAIPGVTFVGPDLKIVYAALTDRYEELDAVLRSLPTPQQRAEAESELETVLAMLRRIYNVGATPAPDDTPDTEPFAMVAWRRFLSTTRQKIG